MSITDFSLEKRRTPLQAGRIAYYEEGAGAPAALLHGCPFSSSIWSRVIPRMSHIFRRLAPDLPGDHSRSRVLRHGGATEGVRFSSAYFLIDGREAHFGQKKG